MNGHNPNWQPGEIQASFSRSAKLYDRATKRGDVVAIPFGRYLLLERIKRGGMAEVYRAKVVAAEGFEKIVAIKRILPHLAANEDFVTMFIDEAKIVSLLNHQNICPVIELGKCDDGLYIVMEYIWGRDLRQILNALGRSGRLMPINVAAYIAARIAEGLDYAHRRRGPNGQPLNLVHRDVSPQNILISYDGEVKLIDFGIARASQRTTQTRVGTFKGKFAYMSPEQARGKELDRRSDIFAVGILLHEMITGKRLFAAKTDLDTLDRVRNCVVPEPARPFEEIPPELVQIAMRALQRKPEDRFQWGGEMQEALDRFLMLSGELASATRLGNWMCVNFSEQAAKALADQERAARAYPPGQEPPQPRPPEPEPRQSDDECFGSDEEEAEPSPPEEYISLVGSGGGPVDPESIDFSRDRKDRSAPSTPPPASFEVNVDEDDFSVEIAAGATEDSDGEISGELQRDEPSEPSSPSHSSQPVEVVEMPAIDFGPADGPDQDRPRRRSSSLRVEYSPWGDEDSRNAEVKDSSAASIQDKDSGVHASAASEEDDNEEFMILDDGPPPKSSQNKG